MTAEIIPFDANRFSRADYEAIRRHSARAIATGHVVEIEWLHGEEGDAILLFDGDGDPVCSFGKQDGKFHAVDHRGKCVAEATRLDDVVERVLERRERTAR
jgi:hypothetical protein